MQLHLPDANHGQQPVAVLFGLTETHPFRQDTRLRKQEGDKKGAAASKAPGSGFVDGPFLLEIVATQYPPSIHVYLVVSFCRRQLRQHVCSSGPAACLTSVRMESGQRLHSLAPPRNDFSQGVIRQSPVDGSMQTFVPSRFVCGLLPQVRIVTPPLAHAWPGLHGLDVVFLTVARVVVRFQVLVDQYSFWQHKTTIVGYPLCSKQDLTKATSLLTLTLTPKSGGTGEKADSALACALVKRLELAHIPVDSGGAAYPARFDLEPFLSQSGAGVELTLLNVLSINFAAAQKQLMQVRVAETGRQPSHIKGWWLSAGAPHPSSPSDFCLLSSHTMVRREPRCQLTALRVFV